MKMLVDKQQKEEEKQDVKDEETSDNKSRNTEKLL
jgi:hypothetical protein